ncbi:hypothetical protein [Kitasatospora fiedleri]|uniref:hypothetical protein n=1 Tax=Kitasatospora fiedleri TaxID=2991545 RepID=UPI00249AB7CC|nr:hypothetical protein [Kitasatospora fiedleri]
MHTPQLVRAALTATSPVFTTALTVTAVATGAVGSAADLPYGIVAGLLPAAGLWAVLPPLLAGGRPVLRTPAVWAAVTAALVGCLTLAAFFYASFLAFVLVPLLGAARPWPPAAVSPGTADTAGEPHWPPCRPSSWPWRSFRPSPPARSRRLGHRCRLPPDVGSVDLDGRAQARRR